MDCSEAGNEFRLWAEKALRRHEELEKGTTKARPGAEDDEPDLFHPYTGICLFHDHQVRD